MLHVYVVCLHSNEVLEIGSSFKNNSQRINKKMFRVCFAYFDRVSIGKVCALIFQRYLT